MKTVKWGDLMLVLDFKSPYRKNKMNFIKTKNNKSYFGPKRTQPPIQNNFPSHPTQKNKKYILSG